MRARYARARSLAVIFPSPSAWTTSPSEASSTANVRFRCAGLAMAVLCCAPVSYRATGERLSLFSYSDRGRLARLMNHERARRPRSDYERPQQLLFAVAQRKMVARRTDPYGAMRAAPQSPTGRRAADARRHVPRRLDERRPGP